MEGRQAKSNMPAGRHRRENGEMQTWSLTGRLVLEVISSGALTGESMCRSRLRILVGRNRKQEFRTRNSAGSRTTIRLPAVGHRPENAGVTRPAIGRVELSLCSVGRGLDVQKRAGYPCEWLQSKADGRNQ